MNALEAILGANAGILGAVTVQSPLWMVAAALIGIGGTLVTTHRPNKTTEAQVALEGMKFLVDSLQTEVHRQGARIAVLGARVVVLEAQLKSAGLTPTDELILP